MKVVAIAENSPYLEAVLNLARANSSTLGFLPPPAFIESAKEKQLLVAIDENGQFLGYLLYGVSAKKTLAYITHLCVVSAHRGSGVAAELVHELKSQTHAVLRGVRVRCRRDYEANKIWPSLGFSAVEELPGRGKKETTLTVWWLDYGHPTLFNYGGRLEDSSRLQVSMDANVCFKLDEPKSSDFEECRALLADWLHELIELCVTPELFNEIQRQPDKALRDKSRRWARRFPIVTGSEEHFLAARLALGSLFPGPLTASDKSDIRQLAISFAAGIQFFVTLDPRLLERSDRIFQEFGIHVLRPADLILGQDYLVREAEYQPTRFAGVSMLVERSKPLEAPQLNHTFRAPQGERKQELGRLLGSLLASPQLSEVKVIKETDRPRALFALCRTKNGEVEVPIFRIDSALNKGMAATLNRYLIQEITLTAARERREVTRITDRFLAEYSKEALGECGFMWCDGAWTKLNFTGLLSSDELLERLSILGSDNLPVQFQAEAIATLVQTAIEQINAEFLLRLEKDLWPLKILDLNIPTFIVPIRPEWAMHLFDSEIGSQNLFGGNPHLIFRVENAYYRNKTPRILRAPGRILWYVSKHSGKYQGTEAIRACSYLEEVVVDTPKALFSRYRRLGVYEWKDVLKLAKGNVETKIMGFRFSKTEMLAHPIPKTTLQRIWHKEFDKNFHIQAPIEILPNKFFDLYSLST